MLCFCGTLQNFVLSDVYYDVCHFSKPICNFHTLYGPDTNVFSIFLKEPYVDFNSRVSFWSTGRLTLYGPYVY